MTETTLRNWFGKGFNFFAFNTLLLSHCQKQDWVVAFDPSFLSKSGKQTCGIGYFWSGCAGREMRGLEIAGFAGG
ncbi:hypothetical protein V6R21_02725 [Limibacter armeniacum]|uniref:hypothetical protein n=1 Tax=Limibacter armeniacum TaxID=466084 RepID=UPI002FE5D8D5